MIEGEAGDSDVKHRCSGSDPMSGFGLDLTEALAEPDDHTGHAAIAHQEVGADPYHIDRDIIGRLPDHIGEVGLIGGRKQYLGRTADAEPSQFGEWKIGFQPAARLRQPLEQLLPIYFAHQAPPVLPSSAASCCG